MLEIARAAVIAPGQQRHLLNVTEATSRNPERDAVILLLGLALGMRITEIAQITVADLPLLMTRRGGKFELNVKRRTLQTGERADYLAADSLQSYVTRLYAKAGIKGGSSHSGRRTFATRLYAKTGDMESVQPPAGPRGCRLHDALHRC